MTVAIPGPAKKLLRKKKNESWAMRPAMAGQTSPTLGVGGNLLCEIAHYVFVFLAWGA